MEETCMFCLDTLKQNEQALNPIGCQCEFKSHGQCLQVWFEQKQQYECPICHTVVNVNPIPTTIQVVYVRQEPEAQAETERRMTQRQITERQQKCVGVCCLMLIIWSTTLVILDFIFRN